ncbi:Hypothetical predicted protein [Octopus vulgaris]|uniref:Uncharacterized protein n=1 Tax=Octopus vulgaris TaxID=6645 RepID=A0AA36AMD5_OCTVU|nr:Hypothetical predicted protein [Octopus vulgaris]
MHKRRSSGLKATLYFNDFICQIQVEEDVSLRLFREDSDCCMPQRIGGDKIQEAQRAIYGWVFSVELDVIVEVSEDIVDPGHLATETG